MISTAASSSTPAVNRFPTPHVASWRKHDKDSSVVPAVGQTSFCADELVLDGDGVVIDYPVVWELVEAESRADAQLGCAGAGGCAVSGGGPPPSPLLVVRLVCSRNG